MKLRGPRGRRVWKLGDELRMVHETVQVAVELGGPRSAMKLMRTFLPATAPTAHDGLPEPDPKTGANE